MSLLMEALRKAEEAKRRMQQEQAVADNDSRQAADVAPTDTTAQRSGDSSFTLEERESALTPEYILDNFQRTPDQDLAADSDQQPATDSDSIAALPPELDQYSGAESAARNLAKRQQRAAAASVFVAKQNPARHRKTLTILVIVMVLMIPLVGGVLWYLQSASVSSIGVNPAIANYDLSTRGLVDGNPVAVEQPPPEATLTDSVIEGPNPEDDITPPIAEASPETAITTAPPPLQPAAPAAVATAQADGSLALPERNSASVLEISRSRGTNQVNSTLAEAYDRLQSGELSVASELYQEVLAGWPNNRDALLGLALIYLRRGEPASARELYARALQLNPRDPLAHTGLLQTMQVSNPAEHERTLRTLIGEYPNVPQLELALGNLYASQQRWSEAQGAYYNALLAANRTAGPVHPDYAFNLAVSLEQINEPKAALDYYRQAQALALEVAPGFDPQLLNSRLAYLEQAQP